MAPVGPAALSGAAARWRVGFILAVVPSGAGSCRCRAVALPGTPTCFSSRCLSRTLDVSSPSCSGSSPRPADHAVLHAAAAASTTATRTPPRRVPSPTAVLEKITGAFDNLRCSMTSPLKRLWSIGHHEGRLSQWVRAKRCAQERRQQPQAHRRFSDDQHACRGCHANYFRETAQRRADWMTCPGCGGWYHVRCAGVAAGPGAMPGGMPGAKPGGMPGAKPGAKPGAMTSVRERAQAQLALCGQCAS